MKIIDNFRKHPKYEAALAIIRAKITGAAADVLTNNKTPYHIICILKTLDAAYTDQRPLYAIEAQMVSIKQTDKTLQQFYNAINFALNAIIAKVVTSYKTVSEQKSLIREAHKKAIRTFIVGLRFKTMRHILYGQQPKTLNEAYTIAQTVYYDNEHLQLEYCSISPKNYPPQQLRKPNVSTNMNANKQWNSQKNNNAQNEWNKPKNNYACDVPKPEPMEVDTSNRTNWRQYGKGEYNSSRHRFERQIPQKIQRINQLTEDPIPDDLVSNTSNDSTHTNTSSAFLGE